MVVSRMSIDTPEIVFSLLLLTMCILIWIGLPTPDHPDPSYCGELDRAISPVTDPSFMHFLDCKQSNLRQGILYPLNSAYFRLQYLSQVLRTSLIFELPYSQVLSR